MHKTLYIDYLTYINGIQTAVRVFEYDAHIFIFINQVTDELQRFDNTLENMLKKNWLRKGKNRIVFCNLESKKHLEDVCEMLVALFKHVSK
ncbi:hypothetical protein GVAV_000403 [Gurleya vavrai]